MRISGILLLVAGILILGIFGYGIYLIKNLTGAPPPLPPAWAFSRQSQPMIVSRGCGNLQEGRLVLKKTPNYSQLARQMRWRPPFVRMIVTVNEEGKIEKTNIIRGHPLCDNAVREAVEQWRYTPTLCNGTPTKITLGIRVTCGDPNKGKLDPAIALLLANLHKGTSVDLDEDKFVKSGMVSVEVTLAGPTPHNTVVLTRLGLDIEKQVGQPRVLIGQIALERLDLLRASTAVAFIAPHLQQFTRR